MDDSTSSDSSRVDPSTPPRKKKGMTVDPRTPSRKKKDKGSKVYKQKFRDSWKLEPQFAGWLTKSSRSTASRDLAYCKICNSDVTCGRSEITRHLASQRHKQLSLEFTKTKSLDKYLSTTPVEKTARKLEIQICAFLSENHLPISLCEPLLDLLKAMFPDQISLKKVKLGKQRASNIIRQVFGKHFCTELSTTLSECLFSVIIDETTDRSTIKQMSVIVQYFHDGKFQHSFLDLIEVNDSSANGLFNALRECFVSKNIPLANIVGFCSDTTNVMMGSKHSVTTLLKSVLPHVIIIKCSCHMIHLSASNACLKLPRYIEDLCRNTFSHFSLSSKRQHALREFQKFVDVEPHKILAPGQTRWLSLQACVQRLLEQWNALELYFTELAFSDPTQVNDMIVDAFNNKLTCVYLEFLDYNLGKLNSFNTLFQSESPNFFNLKTETCKLIRSLCSDIMNVTFVKNAEMPFLNPAHPMFSSALLPVESTYVGVSAADSLAELKKSGAVTTEELSRFYQACHSFLVEAVSQIQTRFSLDDSIHKVVGCINPRNASTLSPPSLAFLFDELPQLKQFVDKKLLDEEWRKHYLDEELSSQLHFTKYWDIVFSRKNAAGLPCYPNLTVAMSTLLSLPFSNASVERFFSQLNLTKTSQRSSLKNETVRGLMHAVYHLKKMSTSAHSMNIDEKLIQAVSNVKSDATCSEDVNQY